MIKQYIKFCITEILLWESRLVLWKYKPKVIAITGSVGKTSTKDAVYAVISSKYSARKSHKSFNSEIGLPLTILNLPNAWNNIFKWCSNILHGLELILFKGVFPEYLVLEVGADHPGDIKRVAYWLRPLVSIITKISEVPVHVEAFKDQMELAQEKWHLARALDPHGTLIISADDPVTVALAEGKTYASIGIENQAHVTARNSSVAYTGEGIERHPAGISFDVVYHEVHTTITLGGVLGRQHIYPILTAIAVGLSQGISLEESAHAFASYTPARGRMNILLGINQSILIDDSYNASPEATAEALRTLATLECSGRKIAVLGDMLELGKYSTEEHRKIADIASQSAHMVMTVGMRAKGMNSETHFNTSAEAGAYIKEHVQPGDMILIKGSQGVRMEKITKALLRDPHQAEEVLVRQEKEWLKR